MSLVRNYPPIVYVPGVWDLLHVGHIAILQTASSYGKVVVGVASDNIVNEDKGFFPVIPEVERLEMVRSLEYVFESELYYRLEFLTHLNTYNPDILMVGEDWENESRHTEAEQWIESNRRKLIKVPRYPYQSSSNIRSKILRSKLCLGEYQDSKLKQQ